MSSHFPCMGILIKGKERNGGEHFTLISLHSPHFIHPQNAKKGEGKIFNSSPPFPSISSHNISKPNAYKSPSFLSFPSLPVHYLPLSSPTLSQSKQCISCQRITNLKIKPAINLGTKNCCSHRDTGSCSIMQFTCLFMTNVFLYLSGKYRN